MRTWKHFVNKLLFILPLWVESIKRVGLWWGSDFRGSKYGTSILRAQKLHTIGLQQVRDLWDLNLNGFHSWEEGRDRF
jgi:hypothetical protein